METFYAPLLNPRTNAQIFPGLERGGELIWGAQAANGGMVAQSAYGRGAWLGDAVFQDPTWNYKTFDFDAGLARADQLDAGLMTLTPGSARSILRGVENSCITTDGGDPGISPREQHRLLQQRVERRSAARPTCGTPTACSWCLVWVTASAATVQPLFDPIGAMERWVEEREHQSDDRLSVDRWQSRSHASALPVSTGGRVPAKRDRNHRRCREFRVSCTVGDHFNPKSPTGDRRQWRGSTMRV